MRTISLTKTTSEDIIKTLKQGGLIIAPSDTVYGLLVDATSDKAVEKLIQFKNRPPGKPISVFVADVDMFNSLVQVNEKQERLLNDLLPGPFTIVLPSKHGVSKKLEAERGTLGVRLPNYSFITSVVKKFGKPVTATSANLSGRHPHYKSSSLLKEFPKSKLDLVDLFIDAGVLPHNKPSTIIDLSGDEMKMLRKGDVIVTNTKTFISDSAAQTAKIGSYIYDKFKKYLVDVPLVFILKGELGAGKTVFAKGIGESLGLKKIISPTYVVYYEYNIGKAGAKFIHVDLYNVENDEEVDYLNLQTYIKQNNIFCIEWGERSKRLFDELKEKAKIVFVEMKYVNEQTREITISEV